MDGLCFTAFCWKPCRYSSRAMSSVMSGLTVTGTRGPASGDGRSVRDDKGRDEVSDTGLALTRGGVVRYLEGGRAIGDPV